MSHTALVVGAAGGVGREVVRQLLAADCRVIATVLNDAEAGRVREDSPGVASIITMDLADADRVVTELRQALTAVDMVAVCAAIGPYGPLEIVPLAQLRSALEINTVACLAVYQATMPLLRASKGSIVFVSSFAGKVGLPFIGSYAASKHALEGLCDVMRREALHSGVKVIIVEPGGIRTPMVTNQLAGVAADKAGLAPAHAALYGDMYSNFARLAGQSWQTMMEPSVVARVVVTALHAEKPDARYPVGDDSVFLCEVARKQDPEIDATVAAFWSQGQ